MSQPYLDLDTTLLKGRMVGVLTGGAAKSNRADRRDHSDVEKGRRRGLEGTPEEVAFLVRLGGDKNSTGDQGEKGIASTKNIKNKGPALCQLRLRGCRPFTPLPESSVERHAHVCPVPLAVTGLVHEWAGGGGVVGSATRELDLPV